MSCLAIQWIKITYRDEHRGAPHAARRRRLRALPLPLLDGDGVYHEVRADASQDFEPQAMTTSVRLRDGQITFEDGVRLRCDAESLALIGPHAWSTRPLFAIANGGWGRVIWNGKGGDSGEQKWLVEHYVNAGRFAAPPSKNVFRGTPAVELDLRRDFKRNGYKPR